jgi:hypothetical protein
MPAAGPVPANLARDLRSCKQQARKSVDILKHAGQKHFIELLTFIEQTALQRGPIPKQSRAWTARCQLEQSRSAQEKSIG